MDGKETNETEKYLKLVKTDLEKDDLALLAKQTGISVENLTTLNLDLNSEITDLGNFLKFSVINDALNYSSKQCKDKNTCWKASIEVASGKRVSSSQSFKKGEGITPLDADEVFKNDFDNVRNPRTGDVVRFAKPGGSGQNNKFGNEVGGTGHGAIFLLKDENRIQVFTKNGTEATQYEVLYINKAAVSLNNKTMIQQYGKPMGFEGGTPYFRKKP